MQTDEQRAIEWLKGRIKNLEEIVARLERDSHKPTDLRPVIQEEISKALAPVTK